MKKIKKSQVKGIINRKGFIEVLVVPNKTNIKSPWVDTTKKYFDDVDVFEQFINGFMSYNCYGVGSYPEYYID